MSTKKSNNLPKELLAKIYDEATQLSESCFDSLCPSYSELKRVENRYQEYELLGSGSLKDVYKVFDTKTKRWVALALIRKERGPDYYDLFIHEAWLIASLNHPNIIKVHDAGIYEDGRPFFTMDLRSNKCLADIVEESERADLNKSLSIFQKVCDAVSSAHAQDIVHLDLKPENIQCDTYGDILLCDWGLSKQHEEVFYEEASLPFQYQELESMTLLGQIKGSLGYMSPEQVIPNQAKEKSSDIYALGCILHFILTKSPPYSGNIEQVLQLTIDSKVPPLRKTYPQLNIPYSLEAIVLKATQREKEDRYLSVDDLQQDINHYLTGYTTQAEYSSFFREARYFFKRNKVLSIVACSALVTLTILTVLFTQYLSTEKIRYIQLNDEYDDLVLSSKSMSKKLAVSARYTKNFNIHESPQSTVKQSLNLANMALDLDPESVYAHNEIFNLNIITLNFKDALVQFKSRTIADRNGYMQFVNAFPEFHFHEKKRPSVDKLIDLLKMAMATDLKHSNMFHRIIIYDHATRGGLNRYDQVIDYYLRYLNPHLDKIDFHFDKTLRHLSIKSANDIYFSTKKHVKTSTLALLNLKQLNLDINGSCNLEELNNLQIEELNIQFTKRIILENPIYLPHLTTLRVSKNLISKQDIRNKIISTNPIHIIWN